MHDPNCYDRRSEKKNIKNGMKLKLRREFPVRSYTNTTTPTPNSTPPPPPPPPPTTTTTLLYSTLLLYLLLLLLLLLYYTVLLLLLSIYALMIVYYISCSATNNLIAQYYGILRLRVPEDVHQIQQQLVVDEESTRMVAKGEGRPKLQTNSSRHM